MGGQPGFSTAIERIDGYRAALDGRGLPTDEALIEPGNASAEDAARAAARLLRLDPRPSAILAGNNLSMIGTMRAVRGAGLSVPGQLALAGFDDFEWAESFEPRLTVMAQPCAAIGRGGGGVAGAPHRGTGRPRAHEPAGADPDRAHLVRRRTRRLRCPDARTLGRMERDEDRSRDMEYRKALAQALPPG